MKQKDPELSLAPLQSQSSIVAGHEEANTIFDLLPVALCLCNSAGIVIDYNPLAASYFGSTGASERLHQKFSDVIPFYDIDGELVAAGENPVDKFLRDGHIEKEQAFIVHNKDGDKRPVRLSVIPLPGKQAGAPWLLICFYECSPLNEAEIRSANELKYLQDYVANASIGMHWVDEYGIIQWANKWEMEMFGYAPAEYIGHHIAEFHADQKRIIDILKRLAANETLEEYEATVRCKNGDLKTVRISSNVLRIQDKFVHTRCFTTDVTEQINLFAKLQKSEQRYRQLIEALQAPVYTTDANGYLQFFNKAAEKLWGRTPQLYKDRWNGAYKVCNSAGKEIPFEELPIATALKQRKILQGEELVFVRPDGSLRNVLPHPQLLFDDNGNVVGAVNILHDITDLKRTEFRLKESEEHLLSLTSMLEQKISERTIDLQMKNEELRKSEEKFHKMIVEVEDYAIILLDKDGLVQNWNRGAEKIMGYSEQEIVGRSFKNFYVPEDRERGLPDALLNEARSRGRLFMKVGGLGKMVVNFGAAL